jgi:hypothetical protein
MTGSNGEREVSGQHDVFGFLCDVMFRKGFAGCSFFILEPLLGFCLTDLIDSFDRFVLGVSSFDRLLPGSSGSDRDTALPQAL